MKYIYTHTFVTGPNEMSQDAQILSQPISSLGPKNNVLSGARRKIFTISKLFKV